MDLILKIVLAVVGLSFLVIVHESGHYLVARAFGMRVLRYSIGLGPALFRYKPKNSPTTFQVCAIPLLAYVQIEGMNPYEEIDWDDPAIFPNKSLFGRISTIAAGPIANYVAAVVLIFAVALVGWPGAEREPMMVGEVLPDSPASVAGLREGDVIVEADGTNVRSLFDLRERTVDRAGMATHYRVTRDGTELEFTMAPAVFLRLPFGIALDGYGANGPLTSAVSRASAAMRAGFQTGDVLLEVDDTAIESTSGLSAWIRAEGRLPETYRVRRGTKELTLSLAGSDRDALDPEGVRTTGVLGVVSSSAAMSVGDAARFAVAFPIRFTVESLKGLAKLATDFDANDVAGPVGMGEALANSANAGLVWYVRTLVILSVALGFFNLLPFPALDGGRLVFLGYELVTRRRPNARVEAAVHTVGILFLLSVLVLVTFRDILS